MGDLGFWALAQEDPDHLALVTPEGRDVTAGELLGRANQLVHALRGIGFETGDVVATLLPNGAEMIRDLPGRAAGRLVPRPHQPPPGRARGRRTS